VSDWKQTCGGRGEVRVVGGRLWKVTLLQRNLCGLSETDSGDEPQSSQLTGFPGTDPKAFSSGRFWSSHGTSQLLLGKPSSVCKS
jgi:hypothetical protein